MVLAVDCKCEVVLAVDCKCEVVLAVDLNAVAGYAMLRVSMPPFVRNHYRPAGACLMCVSCMFNVAVNDV